jgi:ketosteroid isomerase-like protein
LNPDFKAFKNGNIAWATFTSSFEITPKTGDVMKGEGRNTEVLEKRGNDWVIVHDHASSPMPDTPPPPPAKKKK